MTLWEILYLLGWSLKNWSHIIKYTTPFRGVTKREKLDLYEFTILFIITSAILIRERRVKRKF